MVSQTNEQAWNRSIEKYLNGTCLEEQKAIADGADVPFRASHGYDLGRPHHPSLRLHRLQGRLAPLSSVSINMSYRIVLEIVIQEHDIILVDVGRHDQVYRSD